MGVASACKPRAATDFLTGGLREGGWIREASVVEDIIGADACDAHIHTGKRQAFEQTAIDAIAQLHIAYLIIVTCAPVEQIDTYL